MNLANKYRPHTFEDVTEQTVVVDMIRSLCNQENLPNRNFLLTGPAGTGKAQPLDSLVLTPTGFVHMKDVKPGMLVCTKDGHYAKVSDVYPQGKRPIYSIELSDGTSIRVSDNHLNEVYYIDDDGHRVDGSIITIDLINRIKDRNYYIDVVAYPGVDESTDMLYGNTRYSDWIRGVKEFTFNLLGEEYEGMKIPYKYKVAPLDVRIKLFVGLWSDHEKSVLDDISSTSSRLLCGSDDFISLARSIGCIAYLHDQKLYVCPVDDYVRDKILSFKPKSKTSDCGQDQTQNIRRDIVSIEYVGDQDCQCIMVDHPSHTYVSDYYIPTHNTTTARILADVLNDGHGEPIEIDAASHNGVDSIKQIIGQARTYPVGCKYKVFIIDECHSLSSQAWQAMLKVLEEGPAMSVFAFCTTNPEKIPATIISRVQTFQLSKISIKGITNRLEYIIDQENSEGSGISYDKEAVAYIAKIANGGMRDAITLLDKALAYSKSITSEGIVKALDLPEYDSYFELLQAYSKKDNACIADVVDRVYDSGTNFVKWFEGFHSFTINIVKYILLQDIDKTTIPPHYLPKVSNYSSKHAVVCLRLANKLLTMNNELKRTQFLQEVALTYLCSCPRSK